MRGRIPQNTLIELTGGHVKPGELVLAVIEHASSYGFRGRIIPSAPGQYEIARTDLKTATAVGEPAIALQGSLRQNAAFTDGSQ